MLTTEKYGRGSFAVMWNGKQTDWEIVNGNLGMSGRDSPNLYGIVKGDYIKWIGTLAACKKLLACRFNRTPPA